MKANSLRPTANSENAKKKINDAETRAAQWLAEGNAAKEAGKNAKAEHCYEKSQYWLDRYNRLTNQN